MKTVLINSGAYYAYRPMNGYHYNEMMRLVQLVGPKHVHVEYSAARAFAEAIMADAAIETAKAAQ